MGSGGNRVLRRPPFFPASRSSLIYCSTKLRPPVSGAVTFSSISFITLLGIADFSCDISVFKKREPRFGKKQRRSLVQGTKLQKKSILATHLPHTFEILGFEAGFAQIHSLVVVVEVHGATWTVCRRGERSVLPHTGGGDIRNVHKSMEE